jgi:hypothetical protein
MTGRYFSVILWCTVCCVHGMQDSSAPKKWDTPAQDKEIPEPFSITKVRIQNSTSELLGVQIGYTMSNETNTASYSDEGSWNLIVKNSYRDCICLTKCPRLHEIGPNEKASSLLRLTTAKLYVKTTSNTNEPIHQYYNIDVRNVSTGKLVITISGTADKLKFNTSEAKEKLQ